MKCEKCGKEPRGRVYYVQNKGTGEFQRVCANCHNGTFLRLPVTDCLKDKGGFTKVGDNWMDNSLSGREKELYPETGE